MRKRYRKQFFTGFFPIFAALSVFLLPFESETSAALVAADDQYIPYSSEVVASESSEESDCVKHTAEFYPKEIYWGDIGYLGSFEVNTTEETIKRFPMLDSPRCFWNYHSVSIQTKLGDSDDIYYWSAENPTGIFLDMGPSYRELPPGKKVYSRKTALEFPPLEALNDPFWKKLRENLPPEGVECRITFIDEHYVNKRKSRTTTQTFDVVIKPRSESELDLLDRWRANTPEELIYYRGALPNSGRSPIEVGGEKFSPWSFIRVGNRKPSDPNNPTTISGWLRLESSLSPSVMRDEIHLTRLLLEYYEAKQGSDEEERAKGALVDWFNQMPDVQRAVLTTDIILNIPAGEKKTALSEALKK